MFPCVTSKGTDKGSEFTQASFPYTPSITSIQEKVHYRKKYMIDTKEIKHLYTNFFPVTTGSNTPFTPTKHV